MKPCIVTHHAARRATERFGVPRHEAARYVADAWHRSVRLPWRHARGLLRTTLPCRKENPTVRVNGTMLLVCRGASVITVWQLAMDEWATVLLWIATGAWAGGEA